MSCRGLGNSELTDEFGDRSLCLENRSVGKGDARSGRRQEAVTDSFGTLEGGRI